jgi:hypothetical protein
MSLPECVKRLLPDHPPLQEVSNFRTTWAVKGIPLTPIFKTANTAIAICDTEQQIIPSMREIRGEVWYSVDRLEEALSIARRLRIDRVFLSQTVVNGKISAPLSIIGKDSRIAITVAPHLNWDDDEEDEEDQEDMEADI